MATVVANNAANISGKTVMCAENAETVTGLKTFDRDPSAPFAVSSGSGTVANLKIGQPHLCQGRLTLTTAVPITTADVSGATTLYFTPFQGNEVALYDGAAIWEVVNLTQISIAIPAVASQVYDVFCYNNAGTPTLELTAWTNDTTRATNLTLQDGVPVRTGATTRRYLGTIRTTAVAGQVEDSFAKRYVWNYYHRVRRGLRITESTASWSYTTATWRQANGSTANQVEIVTGAVEVLLELAVTGAAGNTAAAVVCGVAIGEDSTSVPLTGVNGQGFIQTQSANNSLQTGVGRVSRYPTVGRHYYTWMEYSTASGTTTWLGTLSLGSAAAASGIVGSIDG